MSSPRRLFARVDAVSSFGISTRKGKPPRRDICLIEDANGLRGSQAKFPKNPFCFLFCVRFNARVDDCSFHGPIVSHSQHRCKMFFIFAKILLSIGSRLSDKGGESQRIRNPRGPSPILLLIPLILDLNSTRAFSCSRSIEIRIVSNGHGPEAQFPGFYIKPCRYKVTSQDMVLSPGGAIG